MSNEDVKLEVTQDSGKKRQWGRGLFYRKDGKKYVFDSGKGKYGVVALFILVTVLLLFHGERDRSFDEDASIREAYRLAYFQSPIELDSYSEIKDSKREPNSRVLRIARLSVVSRTDKVEIPLGSQALAVLLTGGTNGPIKAKLIEDLEFKGEIFIKEGSILWGKGSSTSERLIISFTKFVDEDGISLDITANAYDFSDQMLGLKGSFIGRTSKRIAAGAALGVAGALQTLQRAESIGGQVVVKPSLENALLNGTSTSALGIANQELEELQNKQTIIEVKRGTKILVVFGKG